MLSGRVPSSSRRLLLLHRPPRALSASCSAATTESSALASRSSYRHQSSSSLVEMNVTRHNFKAIFGDLKSDIERPSCRFIAIDTEFTGLSPNEDEKERFIDTLEERYRKVKRAGESFLVTQFGLSTVHVDDAQQFSIKTWNFYIFPRPYGTSDERFLCQASSLQFLSEHGFDFNKFIGEGIPFINLSKTEQLRQRLEKRIENIAKPNKNLSLSDDGLAFQEDVKERLSEWLEKGNGRNGTVLTIPARNSFFKMIIHETVRAKANYLYSESKDDTVEVRVVSNKVKEELLAAKAQEMRDELEDSIGFSKVIEVLSQSKKPIVGHNALLDFVYVFNQFFKPLPDTLAEFKQELLTLFPTIYDTKHATLRSPLGQKLSSTSLSSLFEYMRAHVKPTPENLLSSDPQFEGYRKALQAEGDDDDAKLLCHEAGFDAFMTSVCFLGLLAHDQNGELPEESTISTPALLAARMREMEAHKNCLNLMISDEPFLDLRNAKQTIDRSRVYRVSTVDRKRRLNQIKLEELFAQPNKISRVVREGDHNAFVFLSETTAVKDDATPGKLGVSITPFDEYHATPRRPRGDRKGGSTASTASQTISPVLAAEGLGTNQEEVSTWSRCTIS